VNPEDVRGLSNLGVLLSIESRDEEAMVTLTKALQLQPESSEILTNLASMHHVGVHV
jgi:Flp pilus assembly protein TadD